MKDVGVLAVTKHLKEATNRGMGFVAVVLGFGWLGFLLWVQGTESTMMGKA